MARSDCVLTGRFYHPAPGQQACRSTKMKVTFTFARMGYASKLN
jgi:hypothetical protein